MLLLLLLDFSMGDELLPKLDSGDVDEVDVEIEITNPIRSSLNNVNNSSNSSGYKPNYTRLNMNVSINGKSEGINISDHEQ